MQLGASLIALIPDIDIGASSFGGSPIAKFKSGGLNQAQAAKAASDVLSFLSLMASNEAVRASILGGKLAPPEIGTGKERNTSQLEIS